MERIRAYKDLIKFRVDVVVALTALFGYIIGSGGFETDWKKGFYIFLGGFLVTATAHIINQIIERAYDAQMIRTKNRPLASKKMRLAEALIAAVLLSFSGLGILYFQAGYKVFLISFVSLITYAFLYTPLKRINRIAVYVGAVPGALPVLIGYVGATGEVDMLALLLFWFQVLWQLPHFWSIAWLWHDEYEKAGYDLLPLSGGKNTINALVTFFSVIFLFPVLYLFYLHGYVNFFAFGIMLFLTILFFYVAFVFYKKRSADSARKMMKGSIWYLPIIQLIMIIQIINN